MLYTAVSSLSSHWRRHPGQAAMLCLGLALATALWSGVQAINAEARQSYDRAAAILGQDRLTRLTGAGGASVPRSAYVALRRAGYLVSPVLTGELREGDARLRIIGIDPLTAPAEAQAPALDATLDLAAFFTAPGLLLMTEESAAAPLPPDLPPIRIAGGVPPDAALTDILTAARLLDREDPDYLLVAPQQPFGLPPIAEATDLVAIAPEAGGDIARLTDSFHLNLTAFGLLAFAVGLFITHAAIGLAFEQRRAGFRTLRALGLPLRTLVAALALETALVALISGAIGLLLGYAIAAALMPGVAGTLHGLYGASIPGTLSFDPVWAALALLITLLGAGAATAQALIRTARLPILAPAQPRAWATASRRGLRRQLAASIGLFLIGGAVGLFAEGLLAGFAMLAALLIGAALSLPAILTGALSLVRSGRGAFGEWVLADTRQQVPGLSLVLMALLLALAANIGVSTMVGSFRATFLGWLDQRLASELYVTVADPTEAEALLRFLEDDGRTRAILPILSGEARLRDAPAEVFGIVDDPTYREAWPLLSAAPDAWDRLFGGEGALINEQMARRNDIALGEDLVLAPSLVLPVVGVYSDYGNPIGQAIVSIDDFRGLYPDARATSFALRVPEAEAADLASALRGTFGLSDSAVRNQRQVKAFSIEVFEQTFRVTGALNVLTLGVAALALLTSLLTLSAQRLPQLAPIWAIGMPRRVLAWTELSRSVGLAALTFLAAIPVGLALAWVLLAVVNVEAFGWRLPMRVFPVDWLRLFLLSLLASALAAAWPAWRLARMPPARLVQVFAQER